MRLHRFYVNKPLGEEIVVESVGEEKEIVNQWLRVFRFLSGSEVLLFSPYSLGTDFHYRINTISKEKVTLSLIKQVPNIIPSYDLTLCMALVKKDTFETIVRHATELGASRIIPILAARSEKKNLNFERLQAIAVEAAEQCGRENVPEIEGILDFDAAIQEIKGGTTIVGSLLGSTSTSVTIKSKQVTLWVGPEGGWSDDEEDAFKEKGFTLLKLTETTLKADTAAIAMMSLFAIQS